MHAKIEEILVDKLIRPSYLVEKYEFFSYGDEEVTRVNSYLRNVELCNKEFSASFVFYNNILKRVILMPIIEGIDEPNYPSKEFQEIKRRYCIGLLQDRYGKPSYNDDVCSEWEMTEYKIKCCSIMHGRDKYYGGNIEIEMRRIIT